MHHPPFWTGLDCLDDNALVEGGDGLAEIAGRAPGTVRLLCGHLHRPVQTVWKGLYAEIVSGTGFQFALELGCQSTPSTSTEPYTYFIHRTRPDGSFAVHSRIVAI